MISLLCPTRGRPDSLWESIGSLNDHAADVGAHEVLVAADPDERDSYAWADDLAGVRLWTAPERFGYRCLHEYYNALAAMAAGEWLMIWNDDARMLTPGWDAVIEGALSASPGVLWMKANHCDGGNLFPAWPRAWSEALGHVSLSPHCDMWIQHLGQGLGCQRPVPVEILHDRKDVTGGHDDATYAEGRGPLGPNGTAGPFPYELVRADVEAIRALTTVRI